MHASCLEELLVYQKAVAAADEVSAILKRPSFCKDFNLRDQLAKSSESVAPLIAEGFPLKTDRHFADYLFRAKGSSSETRTHLVRAWKKGHITQSEQEALRNR